MMNFITNNYLLIIIIASFLIFALIGYIVDTEKTKKLKAEHTEEIVNEAPDTVQTIETEEEQNTQGNIPTIEEEPK